MIPTPRYTIGDRVFYATSVSATEQHSCPDCSGTRKWKVIAPSGAEHTCACPRCSNRYGGVDKLPSLSYYVYKPSVRQYTIGSVRIDTASDTPIEYMCAETGVGSGSIYREEALCPDEGQALAVATAIAAVQTGEMAEKPEALYARHFASLTIDQATTDLNWDRLYHTWDAARDYQEVIDKVLELPESKLKQLLGDDLAYELADVIRPRSWRSDHPLAALVRAAVAEDWPAVRAAVVALPRPLPVFTATKEEPDGIA